MAGISLSGLASGLDTASIIDSLMAVERQPRTRIEMRQASEQARRDGLNQIQTQLNTLKKAATELRSTGTWADTQSVTSSDAAKVAVTRTAGAGPGGYDVSVTRLASSTQRTYTYQAPPAGTTLSFTVKDASNQNVTTYIPLAANASIDEAVSTINTTAGSPVYAVNVNGKLVLASRSTGENARFTTGDSAGGTVSQDAERLGQNATFTIDGDPFDSQTNTVSGVIPGLQLTLKGTTSSSVQVDVGAPGPDQTALVAKVKAFTDAYNSVVDTIRTKVSEKPIANASTTSQAKTGALYGDSGLNAVLRQLRQAVSDPVAGNAGALDQMAELGVSTGAASGTISQDAVAGKLTFDAAKLTAALDADPLAVRKLLGGITGTAGFAQRLEGLVDPVAGTGGTLAGRISSEDSTLSRISRDLTNFDERMTRKQAALQKQWSALETALAAAQSRASDITGLSASSS
ncbi:MAG: flagellar hook-associated protein 2 [Solirubrobacteraceae bacterium]|nr:flagellar hook-associated protein 2 [Solirubrobacteraceae bacterium]